MGPLSRSDSDAQFTCKNIVFLISRKKYESKKGKVYDVTEFAQSHPGGKSNILLAAGGDLEPFWNLYRQHQTSMVAEIISQEKSFLAKYQAHKIYQVI